jgi:hypothetical protein
MLRVGVWQIIVVVEDDSMIDCTENRMKKVTAPMMVIRLLMSQLFWTSLLDVFVWLMGMIPMEFLSSRNAGR